MRLTTSCLLRKTSSITANPNEVMDHRYVSKEQLKDLLKQEEEGKVKITPWFRMICERFLFLWWDSLADLSAFVDTRTIHKMT